MAMKKASWFLVAAALVAAAPSACSSDKKSNGGVGGSGGEGGAGVTTGNGTTTTGNGGNGTTTTGNGGSTVSGPTTTGGPSCEGVIDGDCGACAEASCCAETSACGGDADCAGCVTGDTDPSVCDASATFQALLTCLQGSCTDQCFASSECNPVTAEGCDAAGGATCDMSSQGAFACFPPPNDAVVCGACDNQAGPFCGAGMSCFNAKCTHYCCTDADCGTGTCNLSQPVDGVGICVDAADDTQAACDSPAAPPSAGSCYTGKIAAP
jgi:hypothetical protein